MHAEVHDIARSGPRYAGLLGWCGIDYASLNGSARIWDPLSEKPLPVESKIIVTDNDHYSFELWGKAPNGKLMKLMEIQYTRKK